MVLFALIIAIPIHEYAHARSAVAAGDDTPARDGRLTIFPWDHFDPIGGLMCVMSSIFGFGLGWGRPVMVNPRNFRNPRWDDVMVAAWGPLSNLLLAAGFAGLFRLGMHFDWFSQSPALEQLLLICILVNLGLMLFNLLPIFPLDGSHILKGFLPYDMAKSYERFMMAWGPMLLLGLIFFGRDVLWMLISPPREFLTRALIGI